MNTTAYLVRPLSIFFLISLLVFLFPTISFAQNTCDSLNDIRSLFSCFQELVAGFIWYVLFTLATLFFVWGVINYLRQYDSEDKRKESAQFIIWGLVALFVLSSIGPLVQVIRNTFNLPGGGGNSNSSYTFPSTR